MSARRSFAWSTANSALERLVLGYTAGATLSELQVQLTSVIDAFDSFLPFDVTWLLALCKLLGHAELLPTVMSWIDKNAEFNRDRDGPFEAIVQKLTRQQSAGRTGTTPS